MRTGLWTVYGFLWLGGLLSGGASPRFPSAAPLFLVIAGLLALHEHRRAWKPFVGAALLGMAFEFIGIHTGLPFGRYSYTSTLGPALYGVPLAMGFAWLILIDFVRAVTASPLSGSLLMAAVDLVIDPLAAGPLRYWTWVDHGPWFGIPTLNFAGWVLASALILTVIPATTRRPAYVGWSVIGFFAVLALEFRFWLPGAVGFALVVLPAAKSFRQIRSGA